MAHERYFEVDEEQAVFRATRHVFAHVPTRDLRGLAVVTAREWSAQ